MAALWVCIHSLEERKALILGKRFSIGSDDGSDLAKKISFSKASSWASYMGVCLAPGGKLGVPRVHRRIDIKIYPPAMLPFATLYFTGSGHFNRSMRLFCKKKGLKLSDQGLWRREGEAFIHCADEKAIFSACGLEWVEPHARSV